MIFRQYQDVLDGVKTQTRRVLKSWELVVVRSSDGREYSVNSPGMLQRVDAVWESFGLTIHAVTNSSGRRLYEVGKDYAIVPKRGESSVGRFTIVGMRAERLQRITEADAKAEGVVDVNAYRNLWDSINGGVHAWRWSSNPVVLVYEITHRNMNYRRMLEEGGSK